MLRYLYWKDPTNPLLRHFEQTMIIRPLVGKYFDMLRQPVAPLTTKVSYFPYLCTCINSKSISSWAARCLRLQNKRTK